LGSSVICVGWVHKPANPSREGLVLPIVGETVPTQLNCHRESRCNRDVTKQSHCLFVTLSPYIPVTLNGVKGLGGRLLRNDTEGGDCVSSREGLATGRSSYPPSPQGRGNTVALSPLAGRCCIPFSLPWRERVRMTGRLLRPDCVGSRNDSW